MQKPKAPPPDMVLKGAWAPLAQWLNDMRWAMNMKRARAFRRELGFARRQHFDRAIRHPLESGNVIDYPDAIYYVTVDDLTRAMLVSKSSTPDKE